MSLLRKSLHLSALTPALVSLAGPALAEDPQACIDAHAAGQEQRKQGALTAAKQLFAQCVAETCPALIRSDCAAFAAEVEAAMPSVVLGVTSGSGAPLPSARVSIDSAPESLPADGLRIALEPGAHTLRFELPDGRRRVETLVLREGEKGRTVQVRFQDPESAAGFRVPALTYVFGGLGVLAGASFAYFAIDGRGKESDLDACAPRCSTSEWQDEADAMRTSYLAADVSLGVALVSLGLGTYFLVDAQKAKTETQASVQLSGNAGPDGFRVGASGRF